MTDYLMTDAEILTCKNNIYYFINRCIAVDSPFHSEPVKLKLTPHQTEMLQDFIDGKSVCTERQTGSSTVICAYVVYQMLFEECQTIAILNYNTNAAHSTMNRIQYMLKHLPANILPATEVSKDIVRMGSNICYSLDKGAELRGLKFTDIFMDNCISHGWFESGNVCTLLSYESLDNSNQIIHPKLQPDPEPSSLPTAPITQDDILVGFKGKQLTDSGYFYCPYIPLIKSDMWGMFTGTDKETVEPIVMVTDKPTQETAYEQAMKVFDGL